MKHIFPQYSSWDEQQTGDFIEIKVNCLDPNNRRIKIHDLEALKKTSLELQSEKEKKEKTTSKEDEAEPEEAEETPGEADP